MMITTPVRGAVPQRMVVRCLEKSSISPQRNRPRNESKQSFAKQNLLSDGVSHPLQELVVRYQSREERLVGGIAHTQFLTRFFDDLGHRGIINMADSGEQVMFDLE